MDMFGTYKNSRYRFFSKRGDCLLRLMFFWLDLLKQRLKSYRPSFLSRMSQNSMTQSWPVISRLGGYAPTIGLLQASWVRIVGALLLSFAVHHLYCRPEAAIFSQSYCQETWL